MACHLFSLLVLSAAASATQTFNATAIFGAYVSPGTKIASSSDVDFNDILAPRWSTWEGPTYQAAIEPVTENDVQEIVKIASENCIPFLATRNGHGTSTGYGIVTDALNINLANFNSVTVHANQNLLVVGGGVNFGDVFGPLFDAGKELQTGNTNCVGLIGATIGGGIGSMQGLHGLILDALKSVRIVVASGSLITASETENSDLFWAIRGAGANFGIITEATYSVHDQTNGGYVNMGYFTFSAPSNGSLWELLQSFDEYIPPELALLVQAQFNHTTNLAFLTAGVIYYGPTADAQPYFDQFIALGPVQQTILNVTTLEMYSILSQSACSNGERVNDYSIGLAQTDVSTVIDIFAEWTNFSATHSDYNGFLVFQRYSNEVLLQTPINETAYPWRDIKMHWLLDNIYTDADIDSEVYSMSQSIRSKLQAVSGFSEPHVYVNYDHGDEGPAAKYGSSLPKLRALKEEWDPLDLFGTPNPLY